MFATFGGMSDPGSLPRRASPGGQAYYRGFLYFNPATSVAVIYAFNTTSETSGQKHADLRDRVFDFLAK